MAHVKHAATILLVGVAAAFAIAEPARAQKPGGILRSYNSSNPPSASIIEEATVATAMSFSGIFNNLVMFDHRSRETAWIPSCRSWPRAGPGTRRVPS
jgi:hypothetical protein